MKKKHISARHFLLILTPLLSPDRAFHDLLASREVNREFYVVQKGTTRLFNREMYGRAPMQSSWKNINVLVGNFSPQPNT